MDSNTKYFFYFLLGVILYLFLKDIIVEGFGIELSVMGKILNENENLGCINHAGQCLEYGLNYTVRTDIKDENYYLCNNATSGSILSTIGNENRCNKELCCEDLSCNKKYFNKGYNCRNRQILPSSTCPFGKTGEECISHCCGQPLSGEIRLLFNSIVRFKNTIIGNDNSTHTIFLKDILYFIYYNIIDLKLILDTPITFIQDNDTQVEILQMFNGDYSPNINHTYENYALLTQYFERGYSIDSITRKYEETEAHFQDIIDNMILRDYVSSSLSETGSDTGEVNFINKFLTNISNIQLRGGGITTGEISNRYNNFLINYLDYDDENNQLSDLELDLKKTLLLITKPSPNIKDGGGEFGSPISLFSFGSDNWKTKRITLSQFHLYL